MKKVLSVLTAILLLAPLSLSAQLSGDGNDLFKPIARYLGSGDTAHLSAWMASTVDISVVSSLNITSRSHAIRILDDFFESHTPAGLQITHTASQPNLKYAVGTLSAGGEKFIVTLFAVFTEKDGFKIQQIKIDRSTGIF
ncbi:MAG: DUF4783 domain-containing protein [Bacteroidota bacterium]|nr:DUF4783 domain-containing protein [Bacteroidota bacterium]